MALGNRQCNHLTSSLLFDQSNALQIATIEQSGKIHCRLLILAWINLKPESWEKWIKLSLPRFLGCHEYLLMAERAITSAMHLLAHIESVSVWEMTQELSHQDRQTSSGDWLCQVAKVRAALSISEQLAGKSSLALPRSLLFICDQSWVLHMATAHAAGLRSSSGQWRKLLCPLASSKAKTWFSGMSWLGNRCRPITDWSSLAWLREMLKLAKLTVWGK